MEKPRLTTRHDKDVYETPAMDILRKEHCMCLHCDNFKPNTPEHCEIAQAFYGICKVHGNAFIMTRCDSYIGEVQC